MAALELEKEKQVKGAEITMQQAEDYFDSVMETAMDEFSLAKAEKTGMAAATTSRTARRMGAEDEKLVFETTEGIEPILSFDQMGLKDDLLRGIYNYGFEKPSAIQETGALQAAKNKLEKQVEELTWRLQLEKRMRVDLEEAKTQENAKLQSALQDIQLQFKETKELLAKECETAKKAAEVVPIIQEVSVVDPVMLEKLTNENEKLKVSRLRLKSILA
ncbi:hypothetical protein GOBAR_AA04349 [Gossypium barbadense]|uniref:DEAD-box RNA helicase Q domain-containing protein n=1 Tax=Gossypium barbadense TaxID=3634 RepID=A0A2P5YKW8_GOSBA|nr:hypothetical protein GOBAR_AA04349 [Gossypium barbadense]